MQAKKLVTFLAAAVGLLVVPLFAQQLGNGPVRIIDLALLYVLLALGLNIVVGYAGLLDLGYVAFYAVGAYMFSNQAWLAARRREVWAVLSPTWVVALKVPLS